MALSTNYLLMFGFAVLAVLFPLAALTVGKLIRPSHPNKVKLEAYECGIPAESQARGRYSVRFYIVAMLFVTFDIETVLLFPWALRYRHLGWYGLGEAGIFLAFLLVAYVYIVQKRALDWA